MSHELHLHKIGPINDCRLTLDSFTILTGPQANGKSTAAKAVYFFRSVKQDILSIMMQGGPNAVTGDKASTWSTVLKQRMKDKFLQGPRGSCRLICGWNTNTAKMCLSRCP